MEFFANSLNKAGRSSLQEQLCLESRKLHLDTVSTTRGSGWVDVKHAIFSLIFESRRLTHPLPRVVLTVSNSDSRPCGKALTHRARRGRRWSGW
jgi:hypothetical protein